MCTCKKCKMHLKHSCTQALARARTHARVHKVLCTLLHRSKSRERVLSQNTQGMEMWFLICYIWKTIPTDVEQKTQNQIKFWKHLLWKNKNRGAFRLLFSTFLPKVCLCGLRNGESMVYYYIALSIMKFGWSFNEVQHQLGYDGWFEGVDVLLEFNSSRVRGRVLQGMLPAALCWYLRGHVRKINEH